ncbi:MAG: class I SAM-dependent methyltransferase, partial [Candidatus Sungbacteria bacterium]|nr:class I SAM-dependent methyltransferase [Candidatus Sungbacteria bacterium]
PTIVDFFTAALASSLKKATGAASVITATNVFAHIDDLDDLAKAISTLLTPRGLFIVEVPHVLTLVKNTEYDTVYHQHVSYVGIKPLIPFFRAHGLELFDVEERNIHGGTIRLFISRKGAYPVMPSIKQMIAAEQKANVYDPEALKKTFSKKVATQRAELITLLQDLKSKGKTIVGVSAPAKGNTLLNYCNITSDLLDYITEKTEAKIGRYTPGTHIKIESDDKLLHDMPDYALILAWNFSNEIMANLSEYKSRGGKFIIPIPRPKIV